MAIDSTRATQTLELRGEPTPVVRLISDVWRARALIRVLSRRDFYVRYRRPTFGVLWSAVVPIVQAVALSIIFTRVIRIATPIPYPVFVMSGVLPWTFFSSTLAVAVRAITGGSSMASKVYFPRAVLPLVSVGSNLYAFVPTFAVLLATIAIFRVAIGPQFLTMLGGIVVMVALTSAFSLVFAALHVYFRDVGYVVTAVVPVWFYASAVFFPIDRAPAGPLRTAMIANPATGMVEMFRVALIGLRPYSLPSLYWSTGWTLVLLAVALILFRRFDRVFVDLL